MADFNTPESGVIPWSYSQWNTFKTCPRQYKEKHVLKTIPFVQNDAAKWGDEVHKALEENIKNNKPLPSNMQQYEKFVQGVKLRADKLNAERLDAEDSVALTYDLQKVSWFTKRNAPNPVWFRLKVDVTMVAGDYGEMYDWKGLPLDTPLPTPEGWTTMGDVSEGDSLIGGDGRPCIVVGKSEVNNKDCYELVFNDTSRVVCDHDHRWQTNHGVIDTERVLELKKSGETVSTQVVDALDLPEKSLPVPPYVLGLWLADGKHTSGEITKPDPEVWGRVESYGYQISEDYSRETDKCRTSTVLGLRGELRQLGVLSNKHIPSQYLRGSVDQRTDLLRGLMDGDGNANEFRQQCVFTNCDRRLSEQVVELLLTLGQRPLLSEVKSTGFGKTVDAYPVSFRPQRGLNPFYLARKGERVSEWKHGRSTTRRVLEVNKVPSVPTQCVAVDSPDCTYLCTEKMVTTHNTGKVKDDPDQLHLYAMVGFILNPQLERIKVGYIWLKDGFVDQPREYRRKDLPDMIQYWTENYEQIEEAWTYDQFPERPSGLCKGWCEVTSCPYWEPKRK